MKSQIGKRVIVVVIALVFGLLSETAWAQEMQGPFTADSFGGNWINPSFAKINDASCARATRGGKILVVTDFDFNLPSGSTILGIQVTVRSGRDQNQQLKVQLLKGGVGEGVERDLIPTTGSCGVTTDQTLGGSSDLWGTTWTESQVEAINFGVRITSTSGRSSIRVNSAKIKVFYEPPVVDTDDDGDGVNNNADLCPGTPAGEPVDANGCPDTTPPVLSLPADITEEATGPDGAAVSFTATAEDDTDGSVPVSCDPPSGSTFPLGETTVECSAEDEAGNEASGSFTVTVEDTTTPDTGITNAEDGDSNVLNDGDITLSTSITFGFVGSDLVGIASFECRLNGDAFASCLSGDTFSGLAAGDHTFEVRAIDTSDNVDPSPASFNWTINTAPSCDDAQASKDILWPPNHKFVEITVEGVTDADGDNISIAIDSIFQDEPVNGTGDGDSSPDGTGVGTDTAEVRAERAGDGNGRVYHIGFTADDGRGGSCSGVVTVGVPHDKKDTPGDDGALYDSTSP